MIVGLMTNSFFDTADFDDPVKTIGDYIFMDQLDPATQSRREVSLNYNIGIFNDKLVQVSDSLEIKERSWLSKGEVKDLNIRFLNPTAYFYAQFRLVN